ncbi:hypothetical protein SAZ11_60940 [Streptomyces sp. FXJ1.4098]|nr:hypothetical protein [Streptomyces sp. FXJ1.4098]
MPLEAADEPLREDFRTRVADRFATLHERRYGHATPGAPVEFVALRTTALGALPDTAAAPYAAQPGEDPWAGRVKPVVFGDMSYETPVLRREHLAAGDQFAGPAIVVEATSTTVVPPDATVTVDAGGFLVIKLGGTA